MKLVAGLLVAGVVLLFGQGGAHAADPYPARPVKIVVTYPAGGTSDLIARLCAQILTDKLGKSFVVENRAGGGGNIGADYVAKSPPDGYTLLEGTFGPVTTATALSPNLPYAPAKDFAPIIVVADVANIVIVNPGLPAKSIPELIALSTARPGKLNMAIASLGGTPHLLAEMWKQKAGIDFAIIPYKGTSPALTDLISGQVDIDIEALPAVLPFVKSGKVRALAVAGNARVSQMPDLPTMAEVGYPDVAISAWHGLLAPAGTPKEIVQLINRTLATEFRTPAMREKLRELGADVVANTPEEMEAFLRAETARWAELIARVKIKID